MKKLGLALAAALLSSSAALAEVSVKSCNRTVEFDGVPQRAVSHDSNLTEMMLALELQDNMVGYTGISGWKTLDEELTDQVAVLPELAPKYPNKEILIGADADFFFAGWNYGMRVGGELTPETLEPFGIKVYELTESCIHIGEKPKVSMDDMYNDLLNLGRIFDVEERAEALVQAYREDLAQFKAGLKAADTPLRVFVYDGGEDSPFTAGRYGMPTALIEAAGGTNVTDTLDKSWVRVNWEAVVETNPEVIVIINYGEVTAAQKREFMLNNPAFADMDAVKNDRFVTLEYAEATPGPRNIKAIKKLATAFWGN
ncbi:Vitamin B12-binding protein precursor [Pseudovibrio sp. W64]|uniref:ABC transporter substrate-binding protein n=1 Tax=unclassified Pseudovibrio TaxID=2627060 RepID=UPI0007AEDEFE|nr:MULTISPECIES: ABC transporter substrate-binding protein [unclassified Pseudovibrio]KZK89030.1 Vitamin B12-binding protein precursor [Pseudovibrio sp. Ad5]KZK89302.1 Vitamin B12-binding protein precursor [Pseudovibrio sp. W64]KZK95547.1 Vitamin B12-binding protein precursor [Pseudovibrio sp. Ad46]